jgi:hypothetical protein
MILAAIAAGVKGIYVEKPFVRTLAEADEVVKLCAEKGVRLAIAHRNRYHLSSRSCSGSSPREKSESSRRSACVESRITGAAASTLGLGRAWLQSRDPVHRPRAILSG